MIVHAYKLGQFGLHKDRQGFYDLTVDGSQKDNVAFRSKNDQVISRKVRQPKKVIGNANGLRLFAKF